MKTQEEFTAFNDERCNTVASHIREICKVFLAYDEEAENNENFENIISIITVEVLDTVAEIMKDHDVKICDPYDTKKKPTIFYEASEEEIDNTEYPCYTILKKDKDNYEVDGCDCDICKFTGEVRK